VHEAEDGAVDADPEREREDGEDRERREISAAAELRI
jgi:hypothetical protein